MPRHYMHEYDKDDLISRFEQILDHTFGEIDDKGILNNAEKSAVVDELRPTPNL